MRSSGARALTILSNETVEKIHQATLRILEDIGVTVSSTRVRDLLAGHGCTVTGDRVQFPARVVETILGLSAPEIALHSRTGKYPPARFNGRFMAHNMGACSTITDLETGGQRKCTMQDLADTSRLLSAMDNVTGITPLVYPQDIPQETAQIRMLHVLLQNTEKPLVGPGVTGGIEVKYMKEMMRVLAGSDQNLREKPLWLVGISPISPLQFSEDVCDAIWEAASGGLVMSVLSCPLAGLTSPITFAGCLTQQNVEVLVFLTIARLIDPQAKVMYSARLMFPNMKLGMTAQGIPNFGLAGACAVQLAHRYGLPSNVYGLGSSALVSDAACGYEKAINGILPVLAGTEWLSGVGSLLNGLSTSYEQVVIDNEILGFLYYASRELDVSDQTLAVEVINDVMNGANFLDHPHSFQYIRSAEVFDFASGLGNTRSYEEWVGRGMKTVQDEARDRVRQALATCEVEPLTAEQDRALAEIVSRVELEKGKGSKA